MKLGADLVSQPNPLTVEVKPLEIDGDDLAAATLDCAPVTPTTSGAVVAGEPVECSATITNAGEKVAEPGLIYSLSTTIVNGLVSNVPLNAPGFTYDHDRILYKFSFVPLRGGSYGEKATVTLFYLGTRQVATPQEVRVVAGPVSGPNSGLHCESGAPSMEAGTGFSTCFLELRDAYDNVAGTEDDKARVHVTATHRQATDLPPVVASFEWVRAAGSAYDVRVVFAAVVPEDDAAAWKLKLTRTGEYDLAATHTVPGGTAVALASGSAVHVAVLPSVATADQSSHVCPESIPASSKLQCDLSSNDRFGNPSSNLASGVDFTMTVEETLKADGSQKTSLPIKFTASPTVVGAFIAEFNQVPGTEADLDVTARLGATSIAGTNPQQVHVKPVVINAPGSKVECNAESVTAGTQVKCSITIFAQDSTTV
jgi:hypothetical protein